MTKQRSHEGGAERPVPPRGPPPGAGSGYGFVARWPSRLLGAALRYEQRMPRWMYVLIPRRLRGFVKRWYVAGSDRPFRIVKEIREAEALLHEGKLPAALAAWRALAARLSHNEDWTGRAKLMISVIERMSRLGEYAARMEDYREAAGTRDSSPESGPRIAIFTAITGHHDSVKLPHHLDPRFDYVLFTDAPAPDAGVWRIRPVPFLHADDRRSARFVKTHPHRLLGGFEIAIWMDSNIVILDDLWPLVEDFLASGLAVGAVPNPVNRSIDEEFERCRRKDKDNPGVMAEQYRKYRNEGFSEDDLSESNFMIVDLRHEKTAEFLDLWWREIDSHSKRDQLSMHYALWKSGLGWHRLMARPGNVRNHPHLAYVPHDGGEGPNAKLIEALGAPARDPYEGAAYAEVRAERMAVQNGRRVDVVVCVHDALDHVRQCLRSVLGARAGPHQRLILIDDASDAATARYLESVANGHPGCELHRNERSGGYTKSANRGLAASTGELVILLNSDTVVAEGWAEKLADAVFSTPGAGIVGPMSNAAGYQSLPEHRRNAGHTLRSALPPGLSLTDMNGCCERWTPVHVLPSVPLVHGFCFGVTRAAIDRVGYFDEESFPRGYGEEDDYCFRASDAGFGLIVATHTYVFHARAGSYAKGERKVLKRAASGTVKRKHGRHRFERAARSMRRNPILAALRARTRALMD